MKSNSSWIPSFEPDGGKSSINRRLASSRMISQFSGLLTSAMTELRWGNDVRQLGIFSKRFGGAG